MQAVSKETNCTKSTQCQIAEWLRELNETSARFGDLGGVLKRQLTHPHSIGKDKNRFHIGHRQADLTTEYASNSLFHNFWFGEHWQYQVHRHCSCLIFQYPVVTPFAANNRCNASSALVCRKAV